MVVKLASKTMLSPAVL